jgi:hypothetical protein
LNNGSMPKWKTQSSQLREAMKASRQVAMAQKEAERRGVPLASVLPPSSSPGSSFLRGSVFYSLSPLQQDVQ